MTPEAAIIESMFMIADKEGNDVPFILNPTQRTLDKNLTGRDIVPKARQEGVSALVLARYTVKCLNKRNTRAVVISHDKESTERMFNRVKYYLDNLRGPKASIANNSAHELTFPKTNSMFYIGTAGSRKFGRGDTINCLHMSEYAFWENPKDLVAGLMNAVPMSGEIIIESTGNGKGNDYHSRCVKAASGKGVFKLHFFNWLKFPEYSLDIDDDEADYLMKNLDPDLEEDTLTGILTPGQIAWRRMKLDEMNFDLALFKQEFPITFDQCFQATGKSIFHKIRMVPTNDWKRVSTHVHALEGHPIWDHVYSLGADVSGGVGGDASTCEVLDITNPDNKEQVAEYMNNRIEPDVFAGKVLALADIYNEAFMTVENNNHGIVTLDALRNLVEDGGRIYMNDGQSEQEDHLLNYGFRTSSRTKPLIIGRARSELAKYVTLHSPLLVDELDSFIEHPNGSLGAQDGAHDDLVIALAMGVMGADRAGFVSGMAFPGAKPQGLAARDPFNMTTIIDDMHKGKAGFPVSPQHMRSYK